MKKIFVVLATLVFGMVFLGSAMAIPINGTIYFNGSADLDFAIPNATKMTFSTWDDVETSAGATGDYSSIVSGTATTFQDFSFADPGVVPLWTLTANSITYSFDATSINVSQGYLPAPPTTPFLSAWGVGTAYIVGAGSFDPTPGVWSITTQGNTATLSFSSFTTVPEPATLLSIGLGLVCLAGFGIRRRSMKNKH